MRGNEKAGFFVFVFFLAESRKAKEYEIFSVRLTSASGISSKITVLEFMEYIFLKRVRI